MQMYKAILCLIVYNYETDFVCNIILINIAIILFTGLQVVQKIFKLNFPNSDFF